MGKKFSDDELRARLDYAIQMVPIRSTWVHKKTLAEYIVLTVALREVDCEPLVIYARVGDRFSKHIPWTRHIDEFKEKFECMGFM